MIHKINSNEIQWLFPSKSELQNFESIEQFISQMKRSFIKPFDELIIECLTSLGRFLISSGKQDANIIAAGFWLRKKHLLEIQQQYQNKKLSARGVAYHVAPGNVDTLFFYSIVLSLLVGNYTILRISERSSDTVVKIIDLINEFFNLHAQFSGISTMLKVVSYPKESSITAILSSTADVRVIWGTKQTINEFRQLPSKTDAYDVFFPDRYSVAILQLSEYSDISSAVDQLLADIKPFHQQACSSPKVIYWLNTAQSLQQIFWQQLSDKLLASFKVFPLNENELMMKKLYIQRLAIFTKAQMHYQDYHGLLTVVDINETTSELINIHCGLWIFLQHQRESLDEIKLLGHCQTISYLGLPLAELEKWTSESAVTFKRFVPTGEVLNFSHIWDGKDLILSLTKTVNNTD